MPPKLDKLEGEDAARFWKTVLKDWKLQGIRRTAGTREPLQSYVLRRARDQHIHLPSGAPAWAAAHLGMKRQQEDGRTLPDDNIHKKLKQEGKGKILGGTSSTNSVEDQQEGKGKISAGSSSTKAVRERG